MKKPVVFTQRVFKFGGVKRIRTSVCSDTILVANFYKKLPLCTLIFQRGCIYQCTSSVPDVLIFVKITYFYVPLTSFCCTWLSIQLVEIGTEHIFDYFSQSLNGSMIESPLVNNILQLLTIFYTKIGF